MREERILIKIKELIGSNIEDIVKIASDEKCFMKSEDIKRLKENCQKRIPELSDSDFETAFRKLWNQYWNENHPSN